MSFSSSLIPFLSFSFFFFLLHTLQFQKLDAFQIITTTTTKTRTKIPFKTIRRVGRPIRSVVAVVVLHDSPVPFSRRLVLEVKKNSLDEFHAEDKEMSIQELYRIAMEQDEEWYNEFVRNVLGEEEIGQLSGSGDGGLSKGRNDDVHMDDDDDNLDTCKDSDVNRDKGEPIENDIMDHQVTAANLTDDEIDSFSNNTTIQENIPQSIHMDSQEMESNKDMTFETTLGDDDNDNDNDNDKSNNNNKDLDPAKDPPQSTKDHDIVVQYTDMFQTVQRVPMSVLSKLGYTMEDVSMLQAAVLELILEDEIPMPKGGIPSRWKVEEDNDKKKGRRWNREIQILQKRKHKTGKETQEMERRSHVDVSLVDNGRRRSKRQGQPRTSTTLSKEEEEEQWSGNNRQRRSKREPMDNYSSSQQRQQRQRQRQPRGQSSSTIWMDVPTFKQYLRREADLRLMILGEDWEDWVRGESEWRLNLYKKWMDIVQNGIGNDIMEDLYSVPVSERTRVRNVDDAASATAAFRGGRRPRVGDRESPTERRARSSSSSLSSSSSSAARSTSSSRRMNRKESRVRSSSVGRNVVGTKRRISRPVNDDDDEQSQTVLKNKKTYRQKPIIDDETRRGARMARRSSEESANVVVPDEKDWNASYNQEYFLDEPSRRRRRKSPIREEGEVEDDLTGRNYRDSPE